MTTYYLRDAGGQTLSEFRRPNKVGAQPTWLKDYVYAAGRHVAMIENEVPSVPSGINTAVSAAGQAPSVSLSWTANPELDIAGYMGYRTCCSMWSEPPEPVEFDASTASYTDTNVTEGIDYTYKLAAYDTAGRISEYSDTFIARPGDVNPPGSPTAGTAVAADGQVTLTWTGPTSADLWGYTIYRKLYTASTWENVSGLVRKAQTSFTDTRAANGTQWDYQVKAVDTAGLSSLGVPAVPAWRVTPRDTTPPEVPQGLYAVASANRVDLYWRPSTAPDFRTFRIYRSTSPINPAAPPASLADPNVSQWADVNQVSANTRYYYRIRALDDPNNASALSDELVVDTKDPNLPAPSITAWQWGYCDSGVLGFASICYLPQNLPWGYYVSHENYRTMSMNWSAASSAGTLTGLRVYSRQRSDEPYTLSRVLPIGGNDPGNNCLGYPLSARCRGTDTDPYDYRDFAYGADEPCQPVYSRVSAVGSIGSAARESALSELGPGQPDVIQPPYLPVPENLLAVPEPIDPNSCVSCPSSCTGIACETQRVNPQYYGLTLSWSAGAAFCGGRTAGYHVYRTRHDGTLPPIRLTKQPVATPALRVEYPPLAGPEAESFRGATLAKVFSGPMGNSGAGYGTGNTFGDNTAKAYAVRTVDIDGALSGFSYPVRAHTDAAQATGACYPLQLNCPPTLAPHNYESGPLFSIPDVAAVAAPAPPSNLSWQWRYGRSSPAAANVGPRAGNWAVVKWTLPAMGKPNDYRLMRRVASDPTWREVALDLIPGDDAGIRQFVWAMPRELACQDADYAVKSVDIYGRESALSSVVSMVRHRLIPENPAAFATGTEVTLSWDALDACGDDPSYVLTGYKVVRTSSPASDCNAPMPTDPNAYQAIGPSTITATNLTHTPPVAASSAYWYRVKSLWSDTCSESQLSAGVCISADGIRYAESQNLSYSLAVGLPRPENLTVPAETTSPADVTNPAFYGLNLTWSSPMASCGEGALQGFHVYRSRWDGSQYVGPPIRLTRLDQPLANPNFRVEYPPIPVGHLQSGVADFTGPAGYRAATELPPTYRVRAINESEQQGEFSNGVRAHANAWYETVPSQSDTTAGPMNERSLAAVFTPADPDDPNLLIGAPTDLSWTWLYGKIDPNNPYEVVPKDRNWAIVKWQAPQSGLVNDYHLLRKTASDADFVGVPQTGFIPGDDTGIRSFVMNMPLELACEDANYSVAGVDVFGRPGTASVPVPVGKHKLVPEAPAAATGGQDILTLNWGLLPLCGSDPTRRLTQYVVERSTNNTGKCKPQYMPDPNSATDWVVIGTSPAGQGYLNYQLPPGVNEPDRYWYRIRADWGASGTSAPSSVICANWRNGQLFSNDEGEPVAELTIPVPTDLTLQTAAARLSGKPWRAEPAELGWDASASPYRTIGQSGGVNPAVALYFYHVDHLGTPRVITDVSGNAVSKHKYLPYGEELSPPPSTNTHEFTGHERDAETGLDYMKARYFGSSMGRLFSVDPVSGSVNQPQTWNRYSYVANSPLRFTDPSGMVSQAPGRTGNDGSMTPGYHGFDHGNKSYGDIEAENEDAGSFDNDPDQSNDNPNPGSNLQNEGLTVSHDGSLTGATSGGGPPEPEVKPPPETGYDPDKWKWVPNRNYDPSAPRGRPGKWVPNEDPQGRQIQWNGKPGHHGEPHFDVFDGKGGKRWVAPDGRELKRTMVEAAERGMVAVVVTYVIYKVIKTAAGCGLGGPPGCLIGAATP